MTDAKDPIRPLVDLGFTELEAAVYTYLVGNSPATGYRVAHDIGRPIANTYKAIEMLHQKGAALVDESGENRQVRAVPPGELLEQLADAFQGRHEAAARALEHLEPSDYDPGVYTLAAADQVVSRARAMLDGADDIVLCDLFPLAVEKLRDELERAAARGVTVVAKIYEAVELDGVEVVVSPRGAELREVWRGTWMNVVVDETEFLLALLDGEATSVRQAVWSGSPFLSVVYHIAFSWELTGSRVELALRQDDTTIAHIRDLIADFRRIEAPHGPGYRAIVQQRLGP